MYYLCAKLVSMSRHQGTSGKGKPSGRGTSKPTNKRSGRGRDNAKSESFSRGNAPIKKRQTASKPSKPSNPDEIRLNKYISNSGICSRRDADMHISVG